MIDSMKKRQRVRAKRVVVAEEVKGRVIRFRVTEKDFKAIQGAAEDRGCTVSLLIIESLRFFVNGVT